VPPKFWELFENQMPYNDIPEGLPKAGLQIAKRKESMKKLSIKPMRG
jgi:hypothetical protein